MPIDCNKHCSDEQNIICGLQNQLAKLELQQTPQQKYSKSRRFRTRRRVRRIRRGRTKNRRSS